MTTALVRSALGLLLAAGLQGCMTTMYLVDRPSQAVLDEMARRCAEDSGVHWYGERPRGIDLWLPGKMTRDPVEDPEWASLTPYTTYSPGEVFFDTGLARSLYVQLAPTDDYYFGPGPDEPAGTYRFRMFEEGDPRCAAWAAYHAARAEPGAPPYRRPDGRCVAWDRIDSPDAVPRTNVFIPFTDEPAKARGLYRDGEVLIIGGQERARFTSYWAINPGSAAERRGQWGIKACETGRRALPAIPDVSQEPLAARPATP